MRITGILRGSQTRKRYVLYQANELHKPYWEYTKGQMLGKDTNLAGPPPKRPPPRLAPHLNPRGLVESVPREMEDMSNYFNSNVDEFGDIDQYQVRDQFDDMKFFAKRYCIIVQSKLCSSGIHYASNRDTYDIWLRDLKAKPEASQIHSGQKMDIELLGQFDTQPNIYNEKIISLDIDKILYYLGLGVSCQQSLLEILGILGYLPVHPSTELRMMKLHETRRNLPEESGKWYDCGGYYKWAEFEHYDLLHGEKLYKMKYEEREDMIAQRTLLRERKEKGLDVVQKSKDDDEEEITYDDDDDDDF